MDDARPTAAATSDSAARFCPSCLAPLSARDERCDGCRYERPAAGWPSDPYIGRLVNGKYRIEAKLGQGGFGVVLRARHISRDLDLGDVVLKFLQPSLASIPTVRRRFVNEARAARALGGPNVVKVFDFDFDEHGVPFMVMEYLGGRSLLALLRASAPLPPARALDIGAQIARALDECHGAGIVHRDLKPSNILVTRGPRGEDVAKVLDFGIAQLPDTSLSLSLVGTPKYMPPEQIRQECFDGAVDVFALGVILFECLTGEPPIAAEHTMQYLLANVSEPPRRLRALDPSLPEALDNLLDAMMAKEAAARPASMQGIAVRLATIADTLAEQSQPSAPRAPLLSLVTETLPPEPSSPSSPAAQPESPPTEPLTPASPPASLIPEPSAPAASPVAASPVAASPPPTAPHRRASRAPLVVAAVLSTLALIAVAATMLLGSEPRAARTSPTARAAAPPEERARAAAVSRANTEATTTARQPRVAAKKPTPATTSARALASHSAKRRHAKRHPRRSSVRRHHARRRHRAKRRPGARRRPKAPPRVAARPTRSAATAHRSGSGFGKVPGGL